MTTARVTPSSPEDLGVVIPDAGVPISDQEFHQIQRLVKESTGIALSEHKRSLVVSRLGKRLRALELDSFRGYTEYLTGPTGAGEWEQFVNAITTNKTDFYREPVHFEFLAQEVLGGLKARASRGGDRRLRIWSAGCSTGEESYTIAITVRDGLGSLLTWDARILASDIDTNVLELAARGIYAAERVVDVPPAILRRHFLRGAGTQAGLVKVAPETQGLVTFRRINLLETLWPIRTSFDCIFCRNVIIYFDRPTQERLMRQFAELLRDDGYLFLGHSESLHGICEQFEFLRNTIYRKKTSRGRAAA
jgi:chemotaxis protein methyltransferase CheR